MTLLTGNAAGYAAKINLRTWFKKGVYCVRREIGPGPCVET